MNKHDEPQKLLGWVEDVDPKALAKMLRHKLDPSHIRPSHLDVLAQQAVVISKRSTCMYYEVGAVIFSATDNLVLSSGYNGAVRGDVDPRFAGCARIVDGNLEEGKGHCRGSHAELNAIGNLSAGTVGISDIEIMVTLHPCYICAKQIVNKGVKKVYYIWGYGREDFTTDFLRNRGVEVIQHRTPYLDSWIDHNGYDPTSLRFDSPTDSN